MGTKNKDEPKPPMVPRISARSANRMNQMRKSVVINVYLKLFFSGIPT